MKPLLLAALAASALQAQAPPQRQTFEVAAIKPSAMQSGAYGIGLATLPGGRLVYTMCKLDYLIQLAYNIQPFQISGGPRWIHEDRFDIEAVPSRSSPAARSNPRSPKLPPNADQRQMLQALLEDRFHLRIRRESKEGPVYLLVTTGRPLQLQPAKDPDGYPWVGSVAGAAIARDGIRGTNATMALIAERLSPYLEHPVIDRTGVTGAYDFRYDLPPDDAPPDLPSAIQLSVQCLGLKLQPGRAAVESLIVESVEKPSPN